MMATGDMFATAIAIGRSAGMLPEMACHVLIHVRPPVVKECPDLPAKTGVGVHASIVLLSLAPVHAVQKDDTKI